MHNRLSNFQSLWVCKMQSVAESLRAYFSGLPEGSLVCAYHLREKGSHQAVYKFLSREVKAHRIIRVSYGVYQVNIASAQPAVSISDVMESKSKAFGKEVTYAATNSTRFQTTGCKSQLRIFDRLVKWVPVSLKRFTRLNTQRKVKSADETIDDSSFSSLTISIFPTVNDMECRTNEPPRVEFDYGAVYGGSSRAEDLLKALLVFAKTFLSGYPVKPHRFHASNVFSSA